MNQRSFVVRAARRAHAILVAPVHSLWMNLRGERPGTGDVPVVINNFNRLTPLKALIAWLERAGVREIIILDNASTYPPLLEYYDSIPHEVIRGENVGSQALWRNPQLWRRVRGRFYVYTDADVVPDEGCPPDAIDRLLDLLRWRLLTPKAGLGLRIDDLPEHYAKKADVLAWEGAHWRREVAPGVFRAPIDTTFALYRPYAFGWARNSLRTGPPYVARHLPWYEDSARPSEEERHYAATARAGVSTWLEGKGRIPSS